MESSERTRRYQEGFLEKCGRALDGLLSLSGPKILHLETGSGMAAFSLLRGAAGRVREPPLQDANI